MLAKFGFSCWNIYVCMACSSPDSPDLSQIRTESVWAKPVPYEQVCASGAPGSVWPPKGLPAQSPARNASWARKHQKIPQEAECPVQAVIWREREKATAAGRGCKPQRVWGARSTLCTRGAVQDRTVPCQNSKGMVGVAGKMNFPTVHELSRWSQVELAC